MLILITLLATILVGVITFYKWKYQFWRTHKLKYLEPTIPFGNTGNPYTRKKNITEVFDVYYRRFRKENEKHFGFYMLSEPIYMPLNLDYVRNIMAKDFLHFTDRETFYNEKTDPLSAHLFAIGGNKWRNLRMKLTPTFTSGKMKMMFHTLVECSDSFNIAVEKLVDSKEPIDIKDALGRFTTDVIGSCAFGLHFNSIKDSESPFRQHGKQFLARSKLRRLIIQLAVSFPTIARALGVRMVPKESADFIMNVVRDTVEYREKNNVIRNDFMKMLIDLKNNKLDKESEGKHDGKSLTVEEIAAQCFVFFMAGFETSSTLMTFTLFELSRNQAIQETARKEVIEVMKKFDGKITYDGLGEMKYLGQVLDESLRMYPPVTVLSRKCVKDYKVPDTDVTIPKETRVFIPVFSIHRDPEYFPNPTVFDPERFSEGNKKNRHPYAFLPFGEGPRNCIGLRFGLMQSKVGMAMLLKNYKWTLDEKTQVPITFSPMSTLATAEGGIWLKAEKIQ